MLCRVQEDLLKIGISFVIVESFTAKHWLPFFIETAENYNKIYYIIIFEGIMGILTSNK